MPTEDSSHRDPVLHTYDTMWSVALSSVCKCLPVTQNIVTHDGEESGGVGPVQGSQLQPRSGRWVRGGYCQVVKHEVQQLPGPIDLGEQLENIRTKWIALAQT